MKLEVALSGVVMVAGIIIGLVLLFFSVMGGSSSEEEAAESPTAGFSIEQREIIAGSQYLA